MIGAPLPAGSCSVCDEPPGLLDVGQPGLAAPVLALPDGADPLGALGFAAGADGGAAVPPDVALCAAAVAIAPLVSTSDSARPTNFVAMTRSFVRNIRTANVKGAPAVPLLCDDPRGNENRINKPKQRARMFRAHRS
jgi:hypothetical protein